MTSTKEDKVRGEIMRFLYEFNKEKSKWTTPNQVIVRLKRKGFDRHEVKRNVYFLADEGLIKKKTIRVKNSFGSGTIPFEQIRISSKGVKLFESSEFSREISRTPQKPTIQVKNFQVVSDEKIRRILERDYQEIQKNINDGCWKSAIILCGGSIEAILLDLLLNNKRKAKSSPKAPKKDLREWGLADLIDVAVDLKLVGETIAKLSHTTREYRNLIHPGREIRAGLRVEPEEARIAVEILNILIRELS